MDNRAQVELAKETLQIFVDHGEKLTDVRNVVHFFYGGEFDALGSELSRLGYLVRRTVEDDGIVAERDEVIGEEWRTTTLASICDLADTFGVKYDGWEASMERQQPSQPSNESRSGLFSKLFGKKQ